MTLHEIDLTGSFLTSPEEWAVLRMPAAYEQGWVSVIIPTYNRAMFLGEAIASVVAQTYRPIELLIVDDGSTDNTPEALRSKVATISEEPEVRMVYIRQPNRGASAARNQGLIHSHGEFIQYLDSDDVLICMKLERHVQALQQNPTMDMVWSDWWVVASEQLNDKLSIANQAASTVSPAVCEATDRIIPSELWPALARRRFLQPLPLWNEITSRWDDWEYALRLLAANPMRSFMPGIYYLQRAHGYGRRYDYDFDAAGVEKAIVAVHEAARAREASDVVDPRLEQIVAAYYWMVFLEALQRGTKEQAEETIQGACRFARRAPFRIKTWLCRHLLHSLGPARTLKLLRWHYL